MLRVFTAFKNGGNEATWGQSVGTGQPQSQMIGNILWETYIITHVLNHSRPINPSALIKWILGFQTMWKPGKTIVTVSLDRNFF